MPRAKRFKTAERATIYHCVTRTVNGEFLLDDVAKELLRKQLHQLAAFCGVELLTYVMGSKRCQALFSTGEEKILKGSKVGVI